uniref:Phosphatidylinositol 5-phosphate 4-kinase type-2 gamma n=2 Tax=Echeneis naucrates TaxID=173247 RepID=A0A665UGJ5_ECHNA
MTLRRTAHPQSLDAEASLLLVRASCQSQTHRVVYKNTDVRAGGGVALSPGARSPEPGARSPEPGARLTFGCGRRLRVRQSGRLVDRSESRAQPPVMAAQGNAAAASSPLVLLAPKTKTKKKHFVQQKVKVFRASDPVLSVFMWGVNHSINDLNQVPVPVMLLPDDFKANTKIKVNNHLFNKENLPGHFKFKEYCPQVFRNLRERFGIEDLDYQVSLTRSPPLRIVEDQGEGLLLNSYDRSLVIKQISSEDVADMHSILSEYHQHIVKCHGSTLLPQFLGMYRVSVDSEETYLMVMRNMFSHRLVVHRKYDLKGSLVAREASDKERGKELPTFKDVDFRNNMQKVYVTEEQKEKFMEKLNRDVEFLVKLKIMDYSLLLGIHDVGRAEREEEEGEEVSNEEEQEAENGQSVGLVVGSYGTSPEGIAGYMSSCKPLGPGEFDPYVDVYAVGSCAGAPQREVYFMGLIDILTQYDTKKKAAHAAKTVKHGAGAEISTVHPEQYAKRFRDFISNIFA